MGDIYSSSPLDELLHPTTSVEFFTTFYERRHLLVPAGDEQSVTGLLTLDDVDGILGESHLRSDYVRIVQDGRGLSLHNENAEDLNQCEGGLEALFQYYRKGASIVLVSLHERWRPLQDLCRSLATPFSARLQANAYLTPARARALELHHDTHDVIVLQTHGSKRWRLFAPWAELPLAASRYHRPEQEPEVVDEFVLHAGDLLYLPRGIPHEVNSGTETSLHVTLGIKPILWSDVISEAVQGVVEGDAALRRSLPPGFDSHEAVFDSSVAELRRLVESALGQVPIESVMQNAKARAGFFRQPALRGHLNDLDKESDIDAQTVVQVRPGTRPTLVKDNHHAHLDFHGKRVTLPAFTQSTLRILLDMPSFKVDDLPDDLDAASRLLLVRRLANEGLLTRTRGNPDNGA